MTAPWAHLVAALAVVLAASTAARANPPDAVPPANSAAGGDPWDEARPADEATPGEEAATRSLLEEEAGTRRRAYGTWRIRYAWPHGPAAALGIQRTAHPASWDCTTTCPFRGLHAQAEIGRWGTLLAAGWAQYVAEADRSERFVSRSFFGWAVRGAVLRTWDGAGVDPAAQTLAGVEATWIIPRCSLSVSVLRRVSGPDEGDDWVLGAGVGWGI